MKVERFMDDEAVAERVLSHVRDGTTDESDEVWREPVENYRSEERFRRELAVLRRLPVPFCPSAALREPGAYVARPAAGVPILAVRGKDGSVSAFRNACRHRGAEVASGMGCAKAFVCPYHGWTYGLDGRLARVQHERGFPDLDKSTHGLVPVLAQERSGIVFVTQSGKPSQQDPGEGLPELVAADHDLIDTHDNEVDANWKVSIEGSIEGYHIRFGHPETFYPYGYDNLNVVEHCGRNSRVTFPFRRIEKLADVPAAERRIEGPGHLRLPPVSECAGHDLVPSHDPGRARAGRPRPNPECCLFPGEYRWRPGCRGRRRSVTRGSSRRRVPRKTARW